MSVQSFPANLKRVYWETTAGCNLRCIHCRRTDVLAKGSPDELTTQQARNLIDELALMGKPVLILSGGEPLFRSDIFEVASYAWKTGLPVALSTNGTLVNWSIAQHLKESGIYYASVSFDGALPVTHDIFRGKGNFERSLRGFLNMKEAGIKVQINFTVTKKNVQELPEMLRLAKDFGAAALYLFLLVPVGCGIQIADSQMLSSSEVEKWLKWVYEMDKQGPIPLKAICAPHYFRIADCESRIANLQNKESYFGLQSEIRNPKSEISERRGCLAGIHMCFISHKGDVFPCGYLPISAGNILRTKLQDIWSNSPVFQNLRDSELLEGRCGICSFKRVCGGCRARAYYAYQNILAEEPFCTYQPV
ncbi:MAG: radical SAM protein [Elusimicrobia bacterium]|nr:radical SAM protein [Elusimicrobiota bacterium]